MSAMRSQLSASTSVASQPARENGGRERRRHPREPHSVPATLYPASGNTDLSEDVMVSDLSISGVGVICKRRFERDTCWRIILGNGPLYLNAKLRIVCCRDRADGRYDVGCEFC